MPNRIYSSDFNELDDDDMPAGLLLLAIQLSRVLHDPEKSRKTRDRLLHDDAADALSNRGPKSERAIAEMDAFRSLMSRRPDLAIAFAQCLATGLLSFERRWPECAGMIAPGAPRIIASPMEEAHRVVRAAERFSDWPGPVGAAAA